MTFSGPTIAAKSRSRPAGRGVSLTVRWVDTGTTAFRIRRWTRRVPGRENPTGRFEKPFPLVTPFSCLQGMGVRERSPSLVDFHVPGRYLFATYPLSASGWQWPHGI